MPTWDTDQYLRFAAERTQPSVDLAARVLIEKPARVVDLGCGPGNSTAVVARRWPSAELLGIDSSEAMIATAKKDFPERSWQLSNIAEWNPPTPYDVVFSNAALQWVPDHRHILPQLLRHVAPAGALAFQIPANFDAPPHRLIRELGASPVWRDFFAEPVREWHVEDPSFYYDVLAPLTSRVDLWLTDYMHVMDGPAAIVDWYRGTGLRPWLDRLPREADRRRFLADYETLITGAYEPKADGKILFPFRRLFVIAYV